MQDVLTVLTELRRALDMQMELETFVEKKIFSSDLHLAIVIVSSFII
jgi:hypothetical protein